VAVPSRAAAVEDLTVTDGPAAPGPGVPDISQARIVSTPGGALTVQILIDEPLELLDEDFEQIDTVTTFLDLDANPATTGPQDGLAPGAEAYVLLYNSGSRIDGAVDGIGLLDSFSSEASGTTVTWTVTDLADLGLRPGAVVGLSVVARHDAGGASDHLPDLGAGSAMQWIRLTLSGPPPVPPSPVPAPVAAAPPAPLAVSRPLGVSRLAMTALGRDRVRTRFGWTGARGPVAWRLTLTARVGGAVRTRTIRGASRRGNGAIARVVRFVVPPGARIAARLRLDHDGRRTVRSASVRRPAG
jgi:hypothetical protein